ncbi:MAG: hypothetical protein WA869_20660 [Alloacidobacterium sp.]|jgi:hypothetical protein
MSSNETTAPPASTHLAGNMAMHTQDLKAEPRFSLFVTQADADGDPLGAARATLIGVAESVPASELDSVREIYLARHENSRYWVDFSDFSFFWLQPVDLYYVGGFGVMRWVEAREYQDAAPDPLAGAAPSILAHVGINFPREVAPPMETRTVLVEMVRQARR